MNAPSTNYIDWMTKTMEELEDLAESALSGADYRAGTEDMSLADAIYFYKELAARSTMMYEGCLSDFQRGHR